VGECFFWYWLTWVVPDKGPFCRKTAVVVVYGGREIPVLLLLLETMTAEPFPQIDIIRAMVIVWRVTGKIIRYAVCTIMHNDCAQCNAHTHMNRPNSSLDWVWSHWAHFTVRRFIFVCVLLCVHCLHVYCVVL